MNQAPSPSAGLIPRPDCPQCRRPVLVVADGDNRGQAVTLDPTPSLHGTWRIIDLPTGTAVEYAHAPGQYRRHTCPPGGAT